MLDKTIYKDQFYHENKYDKNNRMSETTSLKPVIKIEVKNKNKTISK